MLLLATVLVLASGADPVGADCADCHLSIVERYRRHSMARAFATVSGADLAPLASASCTDPLTGYRYFVRAGRDGSAAPELVETRAGEGGAPDHALTSPIRAVVGAGRYDRSFAIERYGLLYFAPVEWSAEAGLVRAPHQELAPHQRLWQPLSRECLSCHVDPEPAPAYPRHLARGIEVRGIDCSGCHGDASAHVAAGGALAGLTRLGALPAPRQLDVCARCHLQGDARVELLPDGAAPFRPGDDLFARRAAFVPRVPDDDFGFVAQADRLALSRCFQRSGTAGAALTCTTCHEPHESSAGKTRAAYDRDCASCHRPEACPTAHGAGRTDGCVDCHMRRSAPFDLRHVAITDHFIRRRPPPPAELETLRMHAAPHGDLVRFRWPLPGEAAAADAAVDDGALAMALTHLGHVDEARPLFAARPPAALDRLARYHFMHGRALEAAGDARGAARAYGTALAREPRDPEARVNLGLLLARQGDAAAEELLHAVAREFPAAAAPWRNLAVLAFARRDPSAFRAALEEALARDPDLAEVQLQLGTILLQGGEPAAAARALEAARALDPDLPGLWTRLGIARFEAGDRSAARAAFAEALRRDPGDADARLGMERTTER